ncbi:MAG TPA: rRNA maturation RNase YbeY [Pyrinomonadaceae bacterium]|jgi:probable rRNA maturation factor
MIEVVNRQRIRKLHVVPWIKRVEKMLDVIGKAESSVTVAFVSDQKIRELNRQFRNVDKATDVLSFPSDSSDGEMGDIAISIETAARQAKENGLTLDGEIAQLLLHGLLHLSGYDHETDNGEMDRLELRLRKKLGI